MPQLLFGLESWVATLCWMAAAVGWHARRPRWWRFALVVVFGLVMLVPWLLLVGLIVQFHQQQKPPFVHFDIPDVWIGLTLLVTVVVGMAWIFISGLRSNPATGERRAAAWPAVRLAILAAVATALAQSTHWMADAQMREQLLDLRREAQVLAESIAPRPVVDSENAASLYCQVFDAMGTNFFDRPSASQASNAVGSPDEAKRPTLDKAPEQPGVPAFRTEYWDDVVGAISPEKEEEKYDFKSPRLKAFLERQRHVRDLIVRASKMPRCSFGRDYTRPSYDMILPEIQEMRAISRYLVIDARQAAVTGDYARCVEDLESLFRVSVHCAEDPFLICLLVSIAVERMAEEAVETILAETPAPGSIPSIRLPTRVPYLVAFDRSLRIEEATGVMLISQFGAEMEQKRAMDTLESVGRETFFPLAAPVVRNLFIGASMRDIRDAYRAVRTQVRFGVSPSKDTSKWIIELGKHSNPLVSSLFPAIEAAMAASLRGEAMRRLTHVGLGLYRYYNAAGADGKPRQVFPDKLEELQPAYIDYLPTDPFTAGAPLKYKKTPKGCLVYSIGKDFTDDNGVENKDSSEPDIVFECVSLPRKGAPAPNKPK